MKPKIPIPVEKLLPLKIRYEKTPWSFVIFLALKTQPSDRKYVLENFNLVRKSTLRGYNIKRVEPEQKNAHVNTINVYMGVHHRVMQFYEYRTTMSPGHSGTRNCTKGSQLCTAMYSHVRCYSSVTDTQSIWLELRHRTRTVFHDPTIILIQ